MLVYQRVTLTHRAISNLSLPSPESAGIFPHICLEISSDRFAGREPAQRSKCIPFATIDARLQGSHYHSNLTGFQNVQNITSWWLNSGWSPQKVRFIYGVSTEINLHSYFFPCRRETGRTSSVVHIMSDSGPDPTSRTGRDCPLPDLSVPNHRAYSDAWQSRWMNIAWLILLGQWGSPPKKPRHVGHGVRNATASNTCFTPSCHFQTERLTTARCW